MVYTVYCTAHIEIGECVNWVNLSRCNKIKEKEDKKNATENIIPHFTSFTDFTLPFAKISINSHGHNICILFLFLLINLLIMTFYVSNNNLTVRLYVSIGI